MKQKFSTVEEYVLSLAEDRQFAINKIREVLKKNRAFAFKILNIQSIGLYLLSK